MALGKIKELHPRDYWKNEALDFTPWLAEEENLRLLGESIAMDLEFESREEQIDGGRADLLCVDMNTRKKVIIENQLTKTDADHLGRIMSYAAALDAYTIIWIADEFDEQYRAAIDWLNQISDEDHNFFGLEIKLLQIGDSPLAPYFKVAVQPNGWSKSVKAQSMSESGDLSATKQTQLKYWNGFNAFLIKHPSKLFRPQKALPQHWSNVAMGKSGIYLSLQVNSIENKIGVVMVIQNSQDDKSNFDKLLQHKDKFEATVKDTVEWRRMDLNKQSNICIFKSYDFKDESKHEEQYQWLKNTVEAFKLFFQDKIKSL